MSKILKFDKKDLLILELMKKNSRMPLNELSKRVKLSKITVKKKMEKMQEEGIIKKFIPIVDFSKLNFETPLFFISFKDVNPKQEEEIISYLIKQKEIGWCTKTLGEWNAAFAAFVRYPSDIFELIDRILNRFPNKILDYHIGLTFQVIDKRSEKAVNIYMKRKFHPKLSRNEKILLRLLDEDCRITFTEVHRRTNMSYRTFKSSIQSLQDKEIVRAFSCQFNNYPLGLENHVLLLKLRKINEIRIEELTKFLNSIKNLSYVVRLMGNYDFDVQFWLKEKLEIEKIISRIKLNFSDIIEHIEHLVYLEEYKLSYLPYNLN